MHTGPGLLLQHCASSVGNKTGFYPWCAWLSFTEIDNSLLNYLNTGNNSHWLPLCGLHHPVSVYLTPGVCVVVLTGSLLSVDVSPTHITQTHCKFEVVTMRRSAGKKACKEARGWTVAVEESICFFFFLILNPTKPKESFRSDLQFFFFFSQQPFIRSASHLADVFLRARGSAVSSVKKFR